MKTQQGTPSLDELRHFIEFLRNVWAALAGVSVFFPLSNAFAHTIPVAKWHDGGFAYVSPAIVSGAATLTCMFVMLWTFGQREHSSGQSRSGGDAAQTAVRAFGIGMVSLAVYLVGHYSVSHDLYFRVFGWESDDLRRLIGDLALLAAYVGFFAFVTRAFVVLGLREYLTSDMKPANTRSMEPTRRPR